MNRAEHLLVTAMEECAEVQQALSKMLRFGIDGSYPDGMSNKEAALREIADLYGVLQMLRDEGIIPNGYEDYDRVTRWARRKMEKVEAHMVLARQRGALTD